MRQIKINSEGLSLCGRSLDYPITQGSRGIITRAIVTTLNSSLSQIFYKHTQCYVDNIFVMQN